MNVNVNTIVQCINTLSPSAEKVRLSESLKALGPSPSRSELDALYSEVKSAMKSAGVFQTK